MFLKKQFSLSILVFALFLSMGCVDLFDEGVDEVVSGMGETACDAENLEELTGSDRDHCYQQLAIKSGNPELCAKVERNAPETKCYLLIAEAKKDPYICLSIDTRDNDAYTQAECFQKVAVASKDVSVCDMMGDQRASTNLGMNTYSKEDCYAALGEPFQYDARQIYEDSQASFTSCQDLAYAKVHGQAPPGSGDYSKSDLYDEMVFQGYEEAVQGYVAPGESASILAEKLQEGDVIIFYFESDQDRDPSSAPHYAVYEDGEVLQVLRYGSVGKLDAQDIDYFFKPRQVWSETLQQNVENKPYAYYQVYRKK
jgi:hypothetical protein